MKSETFICFKAVDKAIKWLEKNKKELHKEKKSQHITICYE